MKTLVVGLTGAMLALLARARPRPGRMRIATAAARRIRTGRPATPMRTAEARSMPTARAPSTPMPTAAAPRTAGTAAPAHQRRRRHHYRRVWRGRGPHHRHRLQHVSPAVSGHRRLCALPPAGGRAVLRSRAATTAAVRPPPGRSSEWRPARRSPRPTRPPPPPMPTPRESRPAAPTPRWPIRRAMPRAPHRRRRRLRCRSPATTTVTTTTTTYAMGMNYAAVPAGSMAINKNGTTYYLNGNTWFQPAFGANGVYYRVVAAP